MRAAVQTSQVKFIIKKKLLINSVLYRLLAYDPNNECRGIFSDWFRFPSCCVCKCYDMPPEYRVTSRSPRFQMSYPDEDDNATND